MTIPPRITAPRIYADLALQVNTSLALPATATRHIQVLRMQPGQPITLFNGQGGQYVATITRMSSNSVEVYIDQFEPVERQPAIAVSLLIGIPANERMDFLIEKTTELGVQQIYPLMFERSVIKLSGERAAKKLAHWQAIAIAACEQCGGNQVPIIHPVMTLSQLLQNHTTALPADRRLLSLQNAIPWPAKHTTSSLCILTGPEGGLSIAEEQRLISQAQFQPYSLGPRTLRADTAPIAALSTLTL